MKTSEELALEQYPVHLVNDDEFEKYDYRVPYREAFVKGYKEANKKLLIAVKLLEYFVNRVEEGSIKSKTTYQLYKDFLNTLK